MSARILVVDDVLVNVKLLEAKLKREYYEVITALDGQEALDKINQFNPDLILLDIMMPGMNGFEVCARIRSNPRTSHIPVIMVTALSDPKDRVQGLEVGADDFLTKPVNDVALFARVRSLLRLKMVMDEWRQRENASGDVGFAVQTIGEIEELASNAKIMIVDDSEIEREKITEFLKQDEHHVDTVEVCDDALVLAAEVDYELILINISMIHQDGLRLLSQLKSNEKTRQTPILLMAEEAELERIVKGLDMGALDYVIKPIDRNEFIARIRIQIRRKRYQERLRSNLHQSLSFSITDQLTGAYNRRYIDNTLPKLLSKSTSDHKETSILLFDIDHFKRVNDTYGHSVGDEVLQEVANRAKKFLREMDLFARIGGEEFLVILPETELESAKDVGQRLLKIISETPFKVSIPQGEIPITVSIGLVVSMPYTTDYQTLIRQADEALYSAKNAGRNQLMIYEHAKNQAS